MAAVFQAIKQVIALQLIQQKAGKPTIGLSITHKLSVACFCGSKSFIEV
jgi:hypothetical protein